MMSVCHPYGQEIVCLCDNVHTVLRCHLVTGSGSGDDKPGQDEVIIAAGER